jgi:phosphoenolpyruvate carboxykinase (ATP)
MYVRSRRISETDGDVYLFADPDWTHPDFPLGLAFFSPKENVAAVLGLRYFGELKKGTLTLGWGIGARNGYASCHAGLKRYNLKNEKKFVMAAFGLSGSGKSTITHARHGDKYDITVLHDDAFVVNVKDKYAIALEPAYFDKVQDYPIGCDDNKYLVSMQNCGVTLNSEGKKIAVTEDLRNGNGRAMKSKFWSPNRIDRIDESLNAIFWLMRDPTIPPVLKLTGPALASVMGATLATKRTSAERLAPGVDINALVCEPYANPFRTYPLEIDYTRFKQLFEDGVDCYVLNTGDFMGKKIKPQHTLGILESIIEGRAEFKKFGDFSGMETMPMEDFSIDLLDKNYREQLMLRFKDRLNFVKSRNTEIGGYDKLPECALKAIMLAVEEMGKY